MAHHLPGTFHEQPRNYSFKQKSTFSIGLMFRGKLVGSSKYACELCQFADFNLEPGKTFSDLFAFFLKNNLYGCVYVCLCMLFGIQGDQSSESKPQDKCINLFQALPVMYFSWC